MDRTRRNVLKLGLGVGATPLLGRATLGAAEVPVSPGEDPGVRAFEDRILRAHRIPLDRIRLTGGPLKHAQDLDRAYLLELEPDRMLAYFRERAGLAPKAKPYDGWDGGGRNLTGHIAGHYLSAVSLMYAATGDEQFKKRADYIVDELKVVQDKNGDGYLVALEGGRKAFSELARGEIRAAAFDLNGLWSPWYTLHKLYAGLRDAYRFTGNQTALEVETRFAAWAEGILSGLSDEQIQHMLNTEFGGMNEVLVDLYADTGDARWLKLSWSFEHRAFIDPLVRHQDDLGGKHGNTQIPKLIGSADRFACTGEPADLMAASFFWDQVADHHSFATGGDGKDEYFGPPDQLNELVNGRTAETCNVYNKLKLTRRMFSLGPDVHYADWHERALFNHILGSMDPEDGRVTYMNPVGQGVTREYQDKFHSFTCCVGSGMESHALHGDGAYYYEDGSRLWVNLYMPSTAEWTDAGARLVMETDFPDGEDAKLTLHLDAARDFTLLVRRPYWVTDAFGVSVNGKPFDEPARYDGGLYKWPFPVGRYVAIERTWKDGDIVEVRLPKSLRLEPVPDNPRRVAILWGPLVLAGDLGPEPERRRRREAGDEAPTQPRPEPPVVPVFVAAERPVEDWLEPVPGDPGRFRSKGVGREPNAAGAAHDVDLVPFWRLHRRTYAAYWDLFTPDEWEQQKAAYSAEAERLRQLEAASVASIQVGETMFERPFHFQSGERAWPRRLMGRPGRSSRSWFSYDVPVDPAHPMTLVVTYYSDDRRSLPAAFDILVDGQSVAQERMERTSPARFFDVAYAVPADLVEGKESVTVRFQAKDESQIAMIFNLRMARADELPEGLR